VIFGRAKMLKTDVITCEKKGIYLAVWRKLPKTPARTYRSRVTNWSYCSHHSMVHSQTSNSCLIKCDWFFCYVLSQTFAVFYAMTELNTYT